MLARRIPNGTRYRAFMKLAAERSGGLFTQINPDEPIAWRAFDLLATLNTPRLMEVRVVDSQERLTFLIDASAVAQGEEICAIARIGRRAGGVNPLLPTRLTVSGKLNGKPWIRELRVKDIAADAGYLPRQWAKLEIDRLLAEGAEKNRPRIVELSKSMYVMSPFTSLLVLETEADYARFNVDRRRKDHWAMYSCPERIPIVYQPLASPPVVSPPVAKDGKKTVEEVLETIVVRVPPRMLRWPNEVVHDRPFLVMYEPLVMWLDSDWGPVDGTYTFPPLENHFLAAVNVSVPGLIDEKQPLGSYRLPRSRPAISPWLNLLRGGQSKHQLLQPCSSAG